MKSIGWLNLGTLTEARLSIKWKEEWPKEAIHIIINFAGKMWSGGAREQYASEIKR